MSECQTPTNEEWREIARRLQEPFDPAEVDFRVQGKASDGGRAQVVAYIDARAVQDRLDNVVGAGAWAFDWQPLVVDNGEVMVAKGTLAIYGVAKSDAGSASNFEQSLGAVSHCFKRAAVHWGIGRYLYNLPMNWVNVERGRIPDATMRELRAKLPRPQAAQQATEQAPAATATVVSEAAADAAVERRSAPARVTRPTAMRPPAQPAASATSDEPEATEQQMVSIRKLCAALNKPEPESALTYNQARQIITQLSGEYQRARRAS